MITRSTSPLYPTHAITHETYVPVINKQISASGLVNRHQSPSLLTFRNTSSSHEAEAKSFSKAPIVVTNHVQKSTDDNSIHSYAPGRMSIVKRAPLQAAILGNRWYEHNYDKRIQTINNKSF